MPELQGQHFLPLLDELFTTGRTYETKGGGGDLEVDGVLKTYYFDYSFKPIRNVAGEIYAILQMAQNVTEQVLAKKKLEESRQNLGNMILVCLKKRSSDKFEVSFFKNWNFFVVF